MPTGTAGTPAQNKAFVQSYADALSRKPKTAAAIDRFVADPRLKEHILQAESAFPPYDLASTG